jgi:hypothetical protein
MKFLLMIATDEQAARARSASEIERTVVGHAAVDRDLRAEGRLVASARLRFSPEARTVRRRDGRHVVTDGPFAEAREQLGGFYLIDVESMDEAIAWAQRLPLAERGAIEVRPIWE